MSKTAVTILADIGLWTTVLTLIAFSILNIAVIIERLIFFRRNEPADAEGTLLIVRDKILAGKAGDAIEICRSGADSLSRITLKALCLLRAREGKKLETVPLEMRLDNALAVEKIRIEKYSWILGTMGAIGPLVGLFGTVLGIMRSFAEIAMRGNSGQGIVEVASAGIWESLYTTAFGILVAVPALIAYNYFVRRSRNQFDMLENAANDLIAVTIEYNEQIDGRSQ
ncbi:MAG: MotA/TolQ/ExbB proton channel family protein [Spirochaetota bacterium]